MSKSTMVELVTELEKLPDCPEKQLLLAEAKAGEFHDYKNQKYPCGKMALVGYCSTFGKANPEIAEALNKIAEEVKEGGYDETPDEEDNRMLRNELLSDTTMNPKQRANIMGMLGLERRVKKNPYGKRYF